MRVTFTFARPFSPGVTEGSDEPIDLLVTDVVMPNMPGPELANDSRVCKQNLGSFTCLAILNTTEATKTSWEGFFLQKPFSRDTLVRKVGESLRTKHKSLRLKPLFEGGIG